MLINVKYSLAKHKICPNTFIGTHVYMEYILSPIWITRCYFTLFLNDYTLVGNTGRFEDLCQKKNEVEKINNDYELR